MYRYAYQSHYKQRAFNNKEKQDGSSGYRTVLHVHMHTGLSHFFGLCQENMSIKTQVKRVTGKYFFIYQKEIKTIDLFIHYCPVNSVNQDQFQKTYWCCQILSKKRTDRYRFHYQMTHSRCYENHIRIHQNKVDSTPHPDLYRKTRKTIEENKFVVARF